MSDPRTIPCGNLIEQPADGKCYLDRGFPSECPECPDYEPGLTIQERMRCEVWTRVMGYHRPVHAFNPGKQSEHAERRYFVDRPGDLLPRK